MTRNNTSGPKPEVTIYTSDSPLNKPGKFFIEMIHDLINSRELAWRLAIRDIRAQYRQTALGLIWAFFLPIVNTITWIFLQRSGVIGIENTDIPYPFYVFSGTMIWAIFSESFNAPLQITTTAKPMLSKINFPREALIISGIIQSSFNALIKVLILLIVLLAMGYTESFLVLVFPIAVFSLIITGTTLGLMLTPIGLLYNDIGKVIPLIMQILMYFTPVVFPIPNSGVAEKMFLLNPLTPLIMTARNWVFGLPSDFLINFLCINIFILGLLFFVWAIYRIAMPILIERMNA